MGSLYVGLLHFPMRNRQGEIVATSTTSMDIHDIARSARTYDVVRYFVITPLPSQREIAWRIRGFWTEGEGASENSRGAKRWNTSWSRRIWRNLAVDSTGGRDAPYLVATSARPKTKQVVSYEALKDRLRTDPRPVYILFGTGMGDGRRSDRGQRCPPPTDHARR